MVIEPCPGGRNKRVKSISGGWNQPLVFVLMHLDMYPRQSGWSQNIFKPLWFIRVESGQSKWIFFVKIVSCSIAWFTSTSRFETFYILHDSTSHHGFRWMFFLVSCHFFAPHCTQSRSSHRRSNGAPNLRRRLRRRRFAPPQRGGSHESKMASFYWSDGSFLSFWR